MTEKVTAVMAARKSSGLTQDEAARITGLAKGTFRARESNPDQLTVGDMRALSHSMNGISKKIMRDWVDSIFSPKQ